MLLGLAGTSALAVASKTFAQTVTYTYDELGRLKTVTYPSGMSITYSYDNAGNRTQVVTQVPDVTPAAVNWANISGNSGATNASQTISGINQAITLTIGYTGSGSIQYSLNSGSYTSIAHNGTISVAASDTLSFKANVASGSASGTVTVTNTTDGSATLDTFTYSVTAVADVTPNAVNWTDVNNSGPGAWQSTNSQTISGIDATITLQLFESGLYPGATLSYSKAGGGAVTFVDGDTLTISNGQSLVFTAASPGSGLWMATVTVKNVSDGNAVLDDWSYTLLDF